MSKLTNPKQKQKFLYKFWMLLGSFSLLAGIVFLVIALISHTITEEAFKIGCLLLIGIVGILIGISLKKYKR